MEYDYRVAFKAACADLGAISALLGFEAYPGVDALLRSITELLAARSDGAHGEPVAWVTPNGEFSDENPRKFSDWTPLYARPQPTADDVLKVLTDLRRKLAALPHRQIELALGEYQAWMLKGDAFDLIDAEIERIEHAKGKRKRKVTVQLWQREDGELCSTVDGLGSEHEYAYVLLGAHTFEVEGE